jgi:hypothetical protein
LLIEGFGRSGSDATLRGSRDCYRIFPGANSMKKWIKLSALGVATGAVSVAAWAAVISNLSGQGCAAGYIGNYHFVNNQTGGAAAGLLNATWSPGESCTVGPEKVNATNPLFRCFASGTLTSASTALPGRLVLSDYSCTPQKCEGDKCEPPK